MQGWRANRRRRNIIQLTRTWRGPSIDRAVYLRISRRRRADVDDARSAIGATSRGCRAESRELPIHAGIARARKDKWIIYSVPEMFPSYRRV